MFPPATQSLRDVALDRTIRPNCPAGSLAVDERRFDLDWLRIIAFGVLIFYHVGMFYVTWDWHVKSGRASDVIEPLMLLVNPWRMSLLFLISGAATRFIADRSGTRALLGPRLNRLWPSLLLAIVLIVPPQSYYEIMEALPQVPSPGTFYLRYLTARGNWCDADGCLITPTYNHMWFVAYLILYTLLLAAVLPLLRCLAQRWSRGLNLLLSGPGLVLTPWAVMYLLRVTLEPRFGASHLIWEDGYLHPLYFLTFVFGFAVAKRDAFFVRCRRLRWLNLAITLVAWSTLMYLFHWRSGEAGPLGTDVRLLLRGIREMQAWSAILAAIGFAHRHLRDTDGPARRILSQAVFPFYLIHQTLIVILAHHLNDVGLPILLEAALLIALTVLGCWLFYDLGRRIPWLRVWIGLRPEARRARPISPAEEIS